MKRKNCATYEERVNDGVSLTIGAVHTALRSSALKEDALCVNQGGTAGNLVPV